MLPGMFFILTLYRSAARIVMHLLTPIGDFASRTATRGRGKGNTITTRPVIAVDNWNYIVGDQKDDGTIVADRFCGSLRHLFRKIGANERKMVHNNIERRLNHYIEYSDDGRTLDNLVGETFFSKPAEMKERLKI